MTEPVYKPCPSCGGMSLAQRTGHSCDLCVEFYKFCALCAQKRDFG